jgi:pyrroloquinoline quinone (PQQ) biosynthesis protein C
MTPSSIIAAIEPPEGECRFLSGLSSRSDSKLAEWARNYYFFSVHQARHLALMVRALDPTDRQSLAEVAKALYEEYGSGSAAGVHSHLFARFAVAAGVPAERLSTVSFDINPAVLAYVGAIEAAYGSGDRSKALGAYGYLERSAVLSYGMMLDTFSRLGFETDALEFFRLHVEQEKGHDAAAAAMIARLVAGDELSCFASEVRRMDGLWGRFWDAFA